VLTGGGNRDKTGLNWTDTYEVDYALSTSGNVKNLTRYACDNGTLNQQFVVALNVSTTTPPAVSCQDVNGGNVACTASSANSVSLTITDINNESFSLTGKARPS
jgi:hypothetical protein